jgi:glutathione synthase
MFDLRDKDPRTLTAIDDAIKHPQRYVLKPQKEGGGNNIFGEEISEKL